jgi:hypothetical protein
LFFLIEIPGPPQFLNNSVDEFNPAKEADQQGSRRHRREKKDLPTGILSFYLVIYLFDFKYVVVFLSMLGLFGST